MKQSPPFPHLVRLEASVASLHSLRSIIASRRNELRSKSMKKSWRKHRVSSNSRHAHLSDYSRLFIPCPPCSGIFNSVLSEILTRLWLELAPSSRACAHNKPSFDSRYSDSNHHDVIFPPSVTKISKLVSSRAKLWGQVSGLDFFLTKQWKTQKTIFFSFPWPSVI